MPLVDDYYQPLEIADESGAPTGRYHYTVTNNGETAAIGYCAEDCPGHETKEEACEHYRQYLLDCHAQYNGTYSDHLSQCSVCGILTNRYGQVAEALYIPLCDEHCDRANLEKFFKIEGILDPCLGLTSLTEAVMG